MARQPRSQRPNPAHASHEEVSRAEAADEHDELHARSVAPTDPSRVLAKHAGDLAERYDAPATDVEEGLRRLAATFLGERAGDAPALAGALHRPPLTLLADALAVMSAGDATRLIREAHLPDLDRRVRTTAWLASPDTPLLSHEELGLALTTLAAELHLDREHIVKTGLPSRRYAVAPWLYHKLGRLYPTRQAASFVPHAERFTNARPDVPPYVWLQTPHRGVSGGGEFRECEYEQADFLAGMSAADGHRVEADRDKLLRAKMSLLARLARALAEGRAESLWDEILKVLTDTFSAPEAAFYAGLDGGTLTPNATDPLSASDPRSPGGLTDWLEVAGHVEQELTVGTLAAVRSALAARGVARLRDLTNQGVPPGQIHFHFRGAPEQTALDAAIDDAVAHGASAGKFWTGFRERAATAFQREFSTPLVIPVTAVHAADMRSILKLYAKHAERALAAGLWAPNPPADMNLFRQDGSSWTIVFGGKLVGKPDAVGLFYIRLLLERQGRVLTAEEMRRERHPSGQDQAARRAALMAKILSGPHVPREQTQAGARREALEQGVRVVPGDDEPAEASFANDSDAVADERAMAEYTARVSELADLVAAAEGANDRVEAGRLRREWQELNDHLESARGLSGRARRLSSQGKKDRDAVVKSINEAVAGFRDALPALHDHLTRALTLGPTCCYHPDPPANWQL